MAGKAYAGYDWDGGPATNARLNWHADVAVDGSGNLYIADLRNHRVRKVTFGGASAKGPDTAGPSDGLAPADKPAFESRMVGNRIVGRIFSIDFVSAKRFIVSGRFSGSYSHSSTGSDSGTLTLNFDVGASGALGGASLNLQFTVDSASRGSWALCGSAFDWNLSGISELGRPPAPLFQDRSGARLDFFIFDVIERDETRAYNLQVRAEASPPASW